MKKVITLLSIVLVALSSCQNKAEKQASEKLSIAQAAYEKGNYKEAKQQIDSIKILYPKAFDAREASQKLLMEVELKLQADTLNKLDNLMASEIAKYNQIKNNYLFEKDTAYQSMGQYIWPSQVIEKNTHRSFLRFQVNEQGIMSFTSIYCGKKNIHHNSVKVTASDGTSAQTPSSKDSYETSDLGEKIEKSDYQKGEDGKVIDFLYEKHNKNIRIDFYGDETYTTSMTASDRQALVEVYHLSGILYSIQKIKKAQEAANLKINFIYKKKEHDLKAKSSEE